MKNFKRTLSIAFAILFAMAFSLTALAADTATVDQTATADQTGVSNFPWARVITLAVIVILVVGAIILAKTNTKLGQRISKFFKEYLSEIKKVSWLSPKDTAKATGIVLVFLIVAAVAIGIMDLGFTQLVKLLADIF